MPSQSLPDQSSVVGQDSTPARFRTSMDHQNRQPSAAVDWTRNTLIADSGQQLPAGTSIDRILTVRDRREHKVGGVRGA
jgi:hypothetical protein